MIQWIEEKYSNVINWIGAVNGMELYLLSTKKGIEPTFKMYHTPFDIQFDEETDLDTAKKLCEEHFERWFNGIGLWRPGSNINSRKKINKVV